ncbi:hypothetical protein Acr_28g0002240 [Actinidia rufa]|uniref:Uncharacterized protein n=1 Tax=Actinidia rufa TaxID=165716 RepID=A0A7J0H8Y6_9ERIC|nr:hypothetical protein Acr_28g0002240 [Actinidia rufa]
MSMERYLGDVGDIIGKIAIWRVSRNCWCRGGENLAMGVKIRIRWRLIEWNGRKAFYLAQGRGGDGTLAPGKLNRDSLARSHAERWTRFTSVKRVRR